MSLLPIILLAFAHALIDTFALFIQPLWPDLQQTLSLSATEIQWIFVFWSLTSSASQLIFGFLGDRYHGRWIVWGAPIAAVVCLSAIGSAGSPLVLCLLLLVGGLAVGAFHPEAAALVGASAPHLRSRAMSLFVLGGSFGQAFGPAYSGFVTTHFGLSSLWWSATWGVGLVLLLAAALQWVPLAPQDPPRNSVATPAERAPVQWGTLSLVLIIGILRVIPAMGILLALAFTLKHRGMRNEDIGWAQGIFQVASGAGVFACAVVVQRAQERLVLWMVPLFALPALALSPFTGYTGLLVCLFFSGLAIGGATPVLISYAQGVLPRAQRLASSITMGVSWGIGGAIVAALVAHFDQMSHPEWSFLAMVPAVLGSSILCLWLPKVEGEQIVLPAAEISEMEPASNASAARRT